MKTLMIVDDSKTFQKLLEIILNPYFEIVAKGSNGNEAIDLYQTHSPDLVLLDITMPNCSGKEALEKIIKISPHAKVVMISGIGDEQTALECKRLGAKKFINKSKISTSTEGQAYLYNSLLEVINLDSIQEAA